MKQVPLVSRDQLILEYLEEVTPLLLHYATTEYEYEDLRQDAVVLILRSLELHPEQAMTLRGYILTGVRNRLIDKGRRAALFQILSLDEPRGGDLNTPLTLGDLLAAPDGDPLHSILMIESLEALPDTTGRKREAIDTALALYIERRSQ